MPLFTSRGKQQEKIMFVQVPGLHLPNTTVGAESQSVGDPKSFATNPKDKETWDAQLFRSITSTSAAGLSVAHNKVANMGLTAGKVHALMTYTI